MTTKPRRESSALPATVQDAIYQTVHQNAKPVKAIAQDANIPAAALYEYADEHRDRKLKVDELPALLRATGNLVILDVLEAASGRVAFRLPTAQSGDATHLQLSRKVIKEFSEALDVYCDATADGVVTEAEVPIVTRQIDDVIAALACIKASLPTQKTGRR